MVNISNIKANNFLQRYSDKYPFILFYGDNAGLISYKAEKYARLAAQAMGLDLQDEFSVIKYQASILEQNSDILLQEINSPAMFGERNKIIWIKDLANSSKLNEAFKRILSQSLDNIAIIIEAKDLKTNSALRKNIDKANNAAAIACYFNTFSDLDNLINEILTQYDLQIDVDCRDILKNQLNTDFLVAKSEIEKLCLYCKNNKIITREDIYNICSNVNDISLDDLVNSILLGDIDKFSYDFAKYSLNSKTAHIILTLLARQFAQLQKIAFELAHDRYHNIDMILENAQPPIYFKKKKIIKQALNYWKLPLINSSLNLLQNKILQCRSNYAIDCQITQDTCMKLIKIPLRYKN